MRRHGIEDMIPGRRIDNDIEKTYDHTFLTPNLISWKLSDCESIAEGRIKMDSCDYLATTDKMVSEDLHYCQTSGLRLFYILMYGVYLRLKRMLELCLEMLFKIL